MSRNAQGRGAATQSASSPPRKTVGRGARTRRHPTQATPQQASPLAVDEGVACIVEHPDGFHWVDASGRQELGPFETVADAEADMAGRGEQRDEGIEALRIAEPGVAIDEAPELDGGDPPEGAT